MFVVATLLAGCGSTVQMRGVAQPDVGGGSVGGGPLNGAATGQAAPAGSGTALGPSATGRTATRSGVALGGAGTVGATSTGTQGHPVVAPGAPLSIGILVATASGLASTGYSFGNTVSVQAVDEALVRALNAHGGLDGHRIKAVYQTTDTFTSSWETDFNAACAKFTQDNHVNAVLGYAFDYFPSFESCLARNSVVHLTTSFNIPDRTELSHYPGLVALDVPTVDRRGLAKADGAIATGYLTAKNKLGIITDDCIGSVRSLDHVVLPFLARAGLPKPTVYTFNCVNGPSDGSNANSAIASAELSFASSGVDRVMEHGVSESGLAQFALDAQAQGYHPGYIVSSIMTLALNNGYVPQEQARNFHGFGWLPMYDVPVSAYGAMNPNQKRCLSLLKSQGITPTASADFEYAWEICEPFFTYEAALRKSGGHTDLAAVINGIHALGSSFVSVTNLDGQTVHAAGRADAVVAARPLVYADACQCWHYTGQARTIPDG